MPELRPLDAGHFNEVYEKYLATDDSLATADDWRRLFDVSLQFADCCGYGLFHDGRIVGMVGMLFGERRVQGRMHRFCNLHSWNVDVPFRGASLLLMRPVLALKDHTLTDFTPTPHVVTINRRLGFKPLDSRLMLMFGSRRGSGEVAAKCWTDPTDIAGRLDEPQAQIMRDCPPGEPFVHVLAETDFGQCHVVAARVVRHWTAYCHVYHLSDPGVFRKCHSVIHRQLLDLTGTRFAAVDFRRFGKPRLPGSVVMPVQTNQFYRAADGNILPGDIDSLYSEVVYLQLTTMPSSRAFLRHLLGRPTLRFFSRHLHFTNRRGSDGSPLQDNLKKT
jgi:hypothetical protein